MTERRQWSKCGGGKELMELIWWGKELNGEERGN
jgi:hypothetical protein